MIREMWTLHLSPEELLHHPATLVEQERRTCHLPSERLEECEFSGAGAR